MLDVLILTHEIVPHLGLTFQSSALRLKLSSGSKAEPNMHRSNWPIALGGALLLYALYTSQTTQPVAAPSTQRAPKVAPKTPAAPKSPRKPCPDCPMQAGAGRPTGSDHAPQLGGIASPDGTVHACIYVDEIDWPKNIASRGLGCCGFRALDYCARLQGVDTLVNWPERIRADGTAGGAYPQKVDQLINKYAPGVTYWQDCSKSHAILAASIASQRACAVDYNGRDPHYLGRIAHCVTCVAFDETNDWVAILDNNYPSLDEIVWMGIREWDQRWGGWAYGLLALTPGAPIVGATSAEEWQFFAAKDGSINFGLTRDGPFGSYCRLNGQDSTPAAILESIGPAMMPIPVKVDHTIEPLKLDLSPLTIALAGGVVLLFYTLARKD